MTLGVDQALSFGALVGSGAAAFFSRRAHRQVQLPHEETADKRTAGDVLEEVSKSQRQLTGLVTAHIADDERFQGQVHEVLQLRRRDDRPRR